MIGSGIYRRCPCCGTLFEDGCVRGERLCTGCTMAGCKEGNACRASAHWAAAYGEHSPFRDGPAGQTDERVLETENATEAEGRIDHPVEALLAERDLYRNQVARIVGCFRAWADARENAPQAAGEAFRDLAGTIDAIAHPEHDLYGWPAAYQKLAAQNDRLRAALRDLLVGHPGHAQAGADSSPLHKQAVQAVWEAQRLLGDER